MRRLLLLSLVLVSFDSHRIVSRALAPFDDPDEAAALFAAKRGITAKTNLHALYAAARAQIAATGSTAIGSWSFLGPGNIGGRTRALLIDPNDANVMYAGAVSGGVWKSIDGGASWLPLSDEMANLAVCTLAFDPADSRTIYAGTGEGYFREDVRGTNLPITGDGIFVTHDGGGTWTQLPSTINDDFHFVNHVAVSAIDSARVYAATRTGVWRSSDAGATWTNVLPTTVKGGCFDLALNASAGSDFAIASCGTLTQATVYRATGADTDAAWQAVLTDPRMARTSLAIAPSNPRVIYAMAACNGSSGGCVDQGLYAVFRSGDAGATWSKRATGTDSSDANRSLLSNAVSTVCGNGGNTPGATMGWHANVLAVDPVDENRLWAGSVDLYRSDDGGRNWGEASFWWAEPSESSYSHADHHVIAFDPHYDGAANQRMFVTNDGGIFTTINADAPLANSQCDETTSRIGFTSLNHRYGTVQFYSGVVFPDGRRFMGGAQDNGTLLGDTTTGIDGWRQIFPGDGGEVGIDATDAKTIYAEYQWARIARSTNAGADFSLIVNGLNDTTLFVTPFAVNPAIANDLWLGGTRLWHSPNGGLSWLPASTAVDGMVSAVAIARGANRVVAGTTTGAIVRNDTASKATSSTQWLSTKPRDGWVSSIVFDAANSNTVYATYAAFGGAHVWRSLDGGATWSAIDGSTLPDLPVHTLATNGARLFIGTDLGVFVSDDGGATWLNEANFPKVITERLLVAPGIFGPALYAFTHGRAAWRVDLTTRPKHRAAGR